MNNDKLMKIINDVQPKGAELMKKVNELTKNEAIGIDDLKDITNTFFDMCEIVETARDKEPITVLGVLGAIGPSLLPAIAGAENVGAQVMDLQDEEIGELVALGDSHNLEEGAPIYKQTLKWIFVSIQTYSVFTKLT